MKTQRKYGDEGYSIPAESMSLEDARRYLDENVNDGIYMQMNEQRRIALELRVKDKK